MRLNYKTKRLRKSFEDDNKLIKEYGVLAKKIRQRKNQLESADNLYVISKLSVLRLHPYKGSRKGLWSIDIHQNWRILFTIDHDIIPCLDDGGVNLKEITIIRIESVEDPH